MPTRREADEVYRVARSRARRTPTIWLRRKERQILAANRRQAPSPGELAQLTALRIELRCRAQGWRRRAPWGEGRWSSLSGH
jgi:hypothetical protein